MANKDPGHPRPSTQCRWLHDWGKWEFIDSTQTLSAKGMVTNQFRLCKRCGYSQTKLDTVWA